MFNIVNPFGFPVTTPSTLRDVIFGTSTQEFPSPDTRFTLMHRFGFSDIWCNYYDHTGANNQLALINVTTGTVIRSVRKTDFPVICFGFPSGFDGNNNAIIFGQDDAPRNIWRYTSNGLIDYAATASGAWDSYGIIEATDSKIWSCGPASAGLAGVAKLTVNWGGHNLLHTDAAAGFSAFLRNADSIGGRVYGLYGPAGASQFYLYYCLINDMSLHQVVALKMRTNSSDAGAAASVGMDGNLYSIVAATGLLKKYTLDGAEIGSYTPPLAVNCVYYDHNGYLWLSDYDGATPIYKVDPVTMTLVQTISGTGYYRVIAEPFPGIVAVWGLGAPTGAYGKIGLLRPS